MPRTKRALYGERSRNFTQSGPPPAGERFSSSAGLESHGPFEVEADGEEPFVARPDASGIFEFRFLAAWRAGALIRPAQ